MRKNIRSRRKTPARRIFFTMIVFFLLQSPLFAKGKQEEEQFDSQNKEFTLCVTAFDVSSLPAGQQVLGPILQRELVADLNRIYYRVRSEDELHRYEEMEWITAMHAAADKLAKEREKRDNLLYQGHPNWKYKQEIKKNKTEIEKLEEAYIKARDRKPLIEERPLFKLLAGNTGTPATFPQPPEKGKEEAFLRNTRVDAFLGGKFRLLYGRIYVEFRIVARGSSFVYEDSAIFSSENLNTAADEVKQRFLAALVNSELVRIVLNAEPENSQIVVNNRIIKKGEVLILPPGPVTIAVSAVDHEGITEELELEGGEGELSFVLKPLPMEDLGVAFPGPNSSVYRGAMYMGGNPVVEEEQTEAAMTEEEETDEQQADEQETGELIAEADEQAAGDALTKPEESAEAEKISEAEIAEGEEAAEIEEGEGTAEGADIAEGDEAPEEADGSLDPSLADKQAGFFSFQVPAGQYQYIRVDTEDGLTGEAIVRGSSDTGKTRIVTLEPRKLPGKDDQPVERARKKFYGAYGRFWIALPLAFFLNGVSQSYINVLGSPNTYTYVSYGAWAATGVFLAETLVRMVIYVHTGTKESIPFKE